MRLDKIDLLRGFALILMIIFHINYSIVNLFNIETVMLPNILWFFIGKFSAILFIFIAGISFFLAEQKYNDLIIKKYIKVSVFLGIIAGGISILTFLFYPEQYIKFGIIHFFSLSFILILFFRTFKYYNILFGFIIILFGIFFLPIINSHYYYFLGFEYIGFKSADYYPLIPYFGIMLLGYSFTLFLKDKNRLDILIIKQNKNIIYRFLIYIGRKSLIIYLIHQPIIIFILYIII